MDSWIETAIGKMHMNKITQRDLAQETQLVSAISL